MGQVFADVHMGCRLMVACSQGDGGCNKVAPELSGASPTEFQVAPHTLASMSWQGLITVIFIIVSWSMACSLPDD